MNQQNNLAITEPNAFELAVSQIEAEFAIESPVYGADTFGLVNRYLDRLDRIAQQRKVIKDQYARINAALDASEAALVWHYGEEVKEQFFADLNNRKGKDKFVDYPFGRIRKAKIGAKLEVVDEAKAIAWAKKNCKDAVICSERLVKTPLNDMLKADGLIPDGCELSEEREKIYPTLDVNELGPKAKAALDHHLHQMDVLENQKEANNDRS